MMSWVSEKRGRTWIEAEGFVIKDKHGVTRGTFSTIEGDAFIALHGANGKLQAQMQVAPLGPSLALYNVEGKTAARLGLSSRGTDLYLVDAEQKLRVAISSSPKGPRLQILDENGTSRITLGQLPNSGGGGSLQGQENYSLMITDQDGKSLSVVP